MPVKENKSEDKKKDLLKFIEAYIKKYGYAPSVREMRQSINVSSPSTVFYYLNKLMEENLITRHEGGRHRTWDIVNKQPKTNSGAAKPEFPATPIPLLGMIAAGQPILAVENYEDVFYMPNNLFRGEGLFMLTVKGESMIEDGIHDGDKVVIKQQPSAENGEIVAALIEDAATVKRFYREKDRCRLQPANSTMSPMYFTEVTILGKVVGLIRKI